VPTTKDSQQYLVLCLPAGPLLRKSGFLAQEGTMLRHNLHDFARGCPLA
jgi:hypothetical protein